MKIAQITDIHIGKKGLFPNEVDVRTNFKKVLTLVQGYEVDKILLTGDLCYLSGEKKVYQWVKEQLDNVSIPYYVIAGNHDSSELLAESFDLSDEMKGRELYYLRVWENNYWFFLDSAVGHLSDTQIEWFKQQFQNAPKGKEVFIAVHHPPVFGGVKHMDNLYAMDGKSQIAIQNIIQNHEGLVHVFCGHYHTDKIITKANMCVHITPSCFVQIDPRFDKFQPDHYRVGFRHIQINSGLVQSAVHYC